MNAAATGVLKELPDVVLAYGISDEYRSALLSPKNHATMYDGLICHVALSSIDLVNYSIDERGNPLCYRPCPHISSKLRMG